MEKRGGKDSDGVLLLHDNAPIHKCNIIEVTIRKAGFVELNHPAYSPDISPSDYYLFSNFFVARIFVAMTETIDTAKGYLNKLDSKFFSQRYTKFV